MKVINNYVRINPIKVGDADKYILTAGKYQLTHVAFETEEEAEDWYTKYGFTEEEIEQIFVITRIADDLKAYLKQGKRVTDINEEVEKGE